MSKDKPARDYSHSRNELVKRIQDWIISQADLLVKETELRFAAREVARYNKLWIKVCLGIIAAVVAVFLFRVSVSAPTIGTALKEHPEKFILIPEARLFTCDVCPPAKDWKPTHERILKFPNVSQQPYSQLLEEAKSDRFWIEYSVTIPPAMWKENQFGVYSHVLLAKSRVFINGVQFGFGKDWLAVIPLPHQKDALVQIEIQTQGTSRFGIMSRFSPIVGDLEELRGFSEIINKQNVRLEFSKTIQLAFVLVFLIMFVSFSLKPEIFWFMVFVGTNLLFLELSYLRATNSGVFSGEIWQTFFTILSAFARSTFLLWFVLEFFRFSLRLRNQCLTWVTSVGLGVSATAWIISRLLVVAHPIPPLLMAEELSYCLGTLLVWVITLVALKRADAPLRRIRIAWVLGFSLMFYYSLNLWYYCRFLNSITSEWAVPLGMVIFIVMILALDNAWGEKMTVEERKTLPKELAKAKTKGRNLSLGVRSAGYMLLLDAQGWSERFRRLSSMENQFTYQKSCNEYLLRAFSGLSETSIENFTGDGFFLAWNCGDDLSRLKDIIRGTQWLLDHPMKISRESGIENFRDSDEDLLKFRAALGRGQWMNGQANVEDLQSAFSCSILMTYLTRICRGSGEKVRVLFHEPDGFTGEIGGFRRFTETAKHQLALDYYEIDASQMDIFLEGLQKKKRAA